MNFEQLLLSLGSRIKEKRLEKKLTQFELASIIDCEIKTIQRIEKGKMNLSLKILISLAQALEISPEELLSSDKNDEN